ncbi:hypothetical protein BOW53_01350 [Solemya pervernicosa gill symbiont]|uniref:GDPGP1-like N-terminal domain-containing protein n=2 Tax=Gammaproteobacteria incertae sedis TaxID=118884 RepID=A0A1T2LAH5_9GAMM|nr:hypothetical protein [Candidatus Reidiella endopervernicosa]OOZ42012.1 hypothetical protein BOW53_01350 [Solemya pervernicosa gill symbiont]QKQ27047.1 hypothetical protein HUE57_12730 [Candidatus Reidiella endopervernicosa]
MKQSDLFSSSTNFRSAFEAGLFTMLGNEGLGTFILACANATFDHDIYRVMEGDLRALFTAKMGFYQQMLEKGYQITDSDEDLLVFLKMAAIGFEALDITEDRSIDGWNVQFNHLRAFRPRRLTAEATTGIRAEYDKNCFNFNKPFLQSEKLWEGDLMGREISLFYNKYPFAELHTLLVPERNRGLPQFLTEVDHRYSWQVVESLADSIPGVGIGYNAYGALASINHLHLQMFIRETPMPVASSQWQHNGGGRAYPARCERFDDADVAWQRIEEFHQQEIPYNLLYLPGRLYCFPRLSQGTHPVPAWSSGLTWCEMSGGMLTFNRDDFERLDSNTIEQALAETSLK